MDKIISQIKELSTDIHEKIIEIRRHIHQNPELAFEEVETAKYIKSILDDNQIEYDTEFGENTVIGIITGDLSGETIGLRADIDALAIKEENEFDYISKKDGIMHACGHDAHTASLLGSAIILSKLKSSIKGKVILIFQPAEEKIPGGAKMLIEKGLITKYNIKKIIGQHVLPEMKTGNFCFGKGFLMAATDELYISFEGTGGHAALPQKRSDTVLALVDFIHSVKLMQKELSCELPFIVAFGKLVADGALNAIPSITKAEGTMRTFKEDLRETIKSKLHILANNAAINNKCIANLEIRSGYPAVYNNPGLTESVIFAAKKYLPETNIENMELRMTAEDFAYYGKEVPAVFYRMGIAGNGKGLIGLHNSKFDLDEEALIHSAGLMAYIAISLQK